MIKSMTGFGKMTIETGNKKIVIEVKSLNSKQLDINLRIPNLYKEKEMEIRNLIKNWLERGKIDVCIYFDNSETEKAVSINSLVVEQYFKQMLEVANTLGVEINNNELLQTIMRFPDTLKQPSEELDEAEWLQLKAGTEKALEMTDLFRKREGEVLIKDILHRIDLIKAYAAEVPQYEGKRIEGVRQRLQEKMKEWQEIQNIDQNRMEQEIIYYLEKLDITEEKVRLANHCQYFIETVEKEEAPGRKLGFIAQEIGREINTMGSKANDHDIQKLVVHMKDELEKIKEQSLNIL
ncbi:YicC/YloC family endoribonuclease [Odoribacter laneus]|uniref:YicC/YloC family endoribonuclease n=1 Tax=Odoribacter laneus TaxID=626933 RepID=UPI0003411DBE|nr:YicC/YloC family endoribonuclease [Odoribacter laneus]CCZ80985.1 tIGR00255 family protein [Odoribacter laneus CAG:561]